MLNSGHTRAQAFTVHSVGEHHEPRHFSTWAAVALACIGRVPDTIASRSICVAMRRKRRDEVIAPYREARVHQNSPRCGASWRVGVPAMPTPSEPLTRTCPTR